MINFIMEGGPFMMLLLILAIIIIVLSIRRIIELYVKKDLNRVKLESGINAIIFWGVISLVLGFFAHYLGLYNAMEAIMRANDISPAIVAEGYAVSLHTILAGLFIFLCSAIIWFALRWRYNKAYKS